MTELWNRLLEEGLLSQIIAPLIVAFLLGLAALARWALQWLLAQRAKAQAKILFSITAQGCA